MMKSRYIGQVRKTWYFSEADWRDPTFRSRTLKMARHQAVELRGEIVIRIRRGRTSDKIASVKYCYDRRSGGRVYQSP